MLAAHSHRSASRRITLLVLTLSLAAAGCTKHHQLSRGGATTLMMVGALLVTAGVAASSGCDNSQGTHCSGVSEAAVGLPIAAAGAALYTASALSRPAGTPIAPTVVGPALPDPLVPSLAAQGIPY